MTGSPTCAVPLEERGEDNRPVVALVPWGLAIEDFLVPNGLSLDDFCGAFTGSWIFGAADALSTADIEAVIVCVSSEVETVTRRVHGATGARMSLLPLPRASRIARRKIAPYARTVAQAFGGPRLTRLLLYPVLFAAKEAAPYTATPIRALAKELDHYGCAALLCQEYEFPRFDVCVAVGRITHVPTFGSFQGGDYQRWRLERILRPLAIRFADGFVVASGAETERLRRRYGVEARRIARIPNAVDTEKWRPSNRAAVRRELHLTADALVVAWHGRVQLRKKGLDTLVDAFALLTAGQPHLELVLLLIGTGADADELRSRLGDGNLANVLWIDRYLHDPRRIAHLLSAADVYAFPSRHEGFPVAPLEAMACGLPIVASDGSGIRDVLAEGEESGGVLVPSEDPTRLADALLALLVDLPHSRELGRRARRRVEEFRPVAVGRQLRSFLFRDGGDKLSGG